MAHIAFCFPPMSGHINPTLGLVEELCRDGHTVSFATSERHAAAVRAAGADALPLTFPSGLSPDDPVQLHGSGLSTALLATLHETRSSLDQMRRLYCDDVPDLVVFDGVCGLWGRLLAEEFGVPAVRCWPTFALIPELRRWFNQYLRPNPLDPRLWFALLGLRRLARSHRLSLEQFLDGIDDTPEHLLFMPRRFHPGHEHVDASYHFVGSCTSTRRSEGDWTPPPSGRPVVFVSLGTIYNRQAPFFHAVVDAFRQTPWHVVVAVGHHVDPAQFADAPANVEIHTQVPQLAVLAAADLFITHAGAGSTMEAAALGVPMITYPRMSEQRAVADQAVAVDIARMLPADDARPDTIRALADSVAGDPAIRAGLAAFGEDVRQCGGPRAAADVIGAALPHHPVTVTRSSSPDRTDSPHSSRFRRPS